jgi:hypothetical protein
LLACWTCHSFSEVPVTMSNECGSSPYSPAARRPWQALCAPSLGPSHRSSVLLKKFQIALTLGPLTSSGSKRKDPRQICPSVRQGFTLTQHMGWGFLPQPHISYTWDYPSAHYVKMSSQGVMPSEKASNHPGLRPSDYR